MSSEPGIFSHGQLLLLLITRHDLFENCYFFPSKWQQQPHIGTSRLVLHSSRERHQSSDMKEVAAVVGPWKREKETK